MILLGTMVIPNIIYGDDFDDRDGIPKDVYVNNIKNESVRKISIDLGWDEFKKTVKADAKLNAKCEETSWWKGKWFSDTKMISYFRDNKHELKKIATIILTKRHDDDEIAKNYINNPKSFYNETLEDEANEIKKIEKHQEEDSGQVETMRRNIAYNNMMLKGYRNIAIYGILGASAGIYALQLGSKYIKDKISKPQFCEETNDKGLIQSTIDSIFGSADESYRRNEGDRLFFNPEQQKTIDAIQVDYMEAMEFDLPCPHYLFYGPQGTGKTSFARILAYETDSTYYIIKASSFLEKDGPRNFTQLMRRVRQQGSRPIILIDEADSLLGYSSEMKGRYLTIFQDILSELGDSDNRLCTFIFTTNLPDRIDPRMVDRLEFIQFINPDIETRQKIIANKLEYYFTNEKSLGGLPSEIEYEELTTEVIKIAAEKTKDWSCRGYAKLIESLRRSLVRKKEFVCTAQNLLDHIEMTNKCNYANAIAQVQLRDQFTYKGARSK